MYSSASRRLWAALCVALAAAVQVSPPRAQADDMLTLQFTVGSATGGTSPGHFIFPFGLAIDSTGRFIVTDTEEYDALDADRDGDVFEVHRANNRVQIFRPDGAIEAVAGGTGSEPGRFWYPTGVAVDALDQIVVVDSGNHRIQILSPAAAAGGPRFVREYGAFGNFDVLDPASEPGHAPADRFYFPTSAAVKPGTRLLDPADETGRLAVVDNGNHRVVVLDAQLNFVTEFGGHTSDDNPPGTFEYPWGVAIDGQGRFFVSDPLNHRVQVFDAGGAFLWAFGSDETSPVPFAADLSSPSAVGFDRQGRLLVADTDRSRILRIDLTAGAGSLLPRCSEVSLSGDLHECRVLTSTGAHYEALVLGGWGSGDTEFRYAQGVAGDALGRVIVVDTDGHQVKVFQPARIEVTDVTASAGPAAGRVDEPVALEVTVANRGGSALGVTLSVNASLPGVLTGDVSVPLGPGAEHTFVLTFVPSRDGDLTFDVGADGLHSTGARVPAAPVTSSAVAIAPAAAPKLLAMLSADRPSAGIGDTVTVTLTLANSGNVVFDTIDPVLTASSGIVTAVDVPPPDLSPLAPGARHLTYAYRTAGEGVVTFSAHVKATYDAGSGRQAYPAQTVRSEEVRILADTAPPITTVSVSEPAGPSGWHRSPFTVTLTADDGEGSGVGSMTYQVAAIQSSAKTVNAGSVSIDVPQAFQGPTTITFFATDRNGNAEAPRSARFLLDSVAPDMGRAGVSPAANPAGWHNSNVVVSFIAGDSASGIASITSPVTVTTEGAGQAIRGTARDQAGNESHAQAVLNIDKTPPVISYTLSEPPNAKGWHHQPVTVSFSAADQPGLSGLAVLTPQQVTISSDGVAAVSASATDLAGNVSTLSVTIRMDRTPPSVLCGTVSGGIVWPPNHKLVPWRTVVSVLDVTSGSAGFALAGVGSSEADNAGADGNTAGDIQGFVIGTPDTGGFVRAERSGTGGGRVYSLMYEGRDLAGNVASCTAATAHVPHDRSDKR
ncbi:MAG: hypothetical protein HYU53_17775 [Acidobacteria bacterium]|nr:hypothetical protein [Acidobacteriota bacterium]